MFQFWHFISVLIIFLNCFLNCEACFFKQPDLESREEYRAKQALKEKHFTRKTSTSTPGCGCGLTYSQFSATHPTDYPWILYIHLNTTEGKRTCPGTIINSNMVITSHKCLMQAEKPQKFSSLSPKEALKLPNENEVILSTKTNVTDPASENIRVKKLIYDVAFVTQFLLAGIDAPEADAAIIVVDVDFNSNQTNQSAICVPQRNDIPLDLILNREGLYQGVRGFDDYVYKYPVALGNFSYIFKAEECNELAGNYVKFGSDTLCISHFLTGPTTEGGPLRIIAKGYDKGAPVIRNYLVGIANWVDRSIRNTQHKYVYFTNMNNVIRNIEKNANEQGSEWCEVPPFEHNNWPWGSFEEGPDESLDCECGIKANNFGRVLGGTPAQLFEFPWQVKIHIPDEVTLSNPGVSNDLIPTKVVCGGSVINNKIILTAASCLVSTELIKASGTDFNVFKEKLYQKDWLDASYENNLVYNATIKADLKKRFYKVRLNAYNDKESTTPLDGYEVYVKRIIIHPGYHREIIANRVDYDIALIVLNRKLDSELLDKKPAGPANGNVAVRQICLPTKGHLEKVLRQEKPMGTLAGWGTDQPETNLTKIDVPIHPIQNCTELDERINNDGLYQLPTDTLLCAGSLISNSATEAHPVDGDNGSPLITESKPGKFTQVGLFSKMRRVKEDGISFTSTYYSNVEGLLQFINYYSKEFGAKGCRQA